MTALPLPYIAAIVDTQCALGTRVAAGTELPMVTLHGPNMPLLVALGEATGVGVREVRRAYSKSPCSTHCDTPHVHISSLSGRWQVTGARATILLRNVLPHLHFRREEAQALYELGRQAPSKGATADKMRQLGWKVAA
ncbi:hypothetical protein GCM10027053_51740 [Intrasporangium mesophilum]